MQLNFQSSDDCVQLNFQSSDDCVQLNFQSSDDCDQLNENFVKQYCNFVHNIDVCNNILTVGEVECAVNMQLKKNLQGRITKQLNIC